MKKDVPSRLILGWKIREMHSLEFLSQGMEALRLLQHRQTIADAIPFDQDGHLLTLAPTGSGKGVGAIIPNLLHSESSIIVVDPKGENYAVTARRRREMGQKVILLDPFNSIPDLVGDAKIKTDSLNPLDLLRSDSPNAADDAQMIADLIMSQKSMGSDPFWDMSAMGVLTGLIHHIGTSPEYEGRRSFRSLVDVLYADDFDYDIAVMIDEGKLDSFARRHMASFLAAPADKTRPSISATARSHCSPLTSESVLNSLSSSSITLDEIRKGEKFTIYIVIPPSKLASHRALLRLWIGVILMAVTTRITTPKSPTVLLIDECAQLGELRLLVQAVTLLRGYGLQVWMFFQDVSQIQAIYPDDWEALVNNSAVLQTFGHNRLAASTPIAELIGGFAPEQIAGLPSRVQLLSMVGDKPVRAQLMRYYSDTAFTGMFESNPYHHPEEESLPEGEPPQDEERDIAS